MPCDDARMSAPEPDHAARPAGTEPPLDADEVATWRGFLRWSERVTAAVSRALNEKAGLSHADYSILIRLADAGGTLPRQALEQSLAWSTSRLSHQLRRMETKNLVRRSETGSGRLVDVELTSTGRDFIDIADRVHAAAVRSALLDDLPVEVRGFLNLDTPIG
jgi:DNA-binding MarR family transcriptional regulator